MGCHHLNTPFRALKLKHPTSVAASCTRMLPETAPLGSIVDYEFPARDGMPALRVVWYDGGLKPPAPTELAGRPLPAEGTLYIGAEGRMLGPEILDPVRAKRFADLPKTLPRRGGTWAEWHEACCHGEPAGCNFDWAGPLTEFVLLGNIALRSGKRIAWDGPAMKITNDASADGLLRAEYRSGWTR